MRGMCCTSTVPCAFLYASNDSIKIYSAIETTCYSSCKCCFYCLNTCLFVVMILLFSYVVNDVSLGKHFQLNWFLSNNMLFSQIVQHVVAICCQFLPISAIEKMKPPQATCGPPSSGPHFGVPEVAVQVTKTNVFPEAQKISESWRATYNSGLTKMLLLVAHPQSVNTCFRKQFFAQFLDFMCKITPITRP